MKSNATPCEIEKHKDDRAFYDMSGEKNYYRYVTTEAKQVQSKSLKFTMLDYFQKTAGVFDENGMLSKEQVKDMQERVQNGQSVIWHGFISFDKDNSYKIENIESCFRLIKQTFGDFFMDVGLERDNLDLMCGLHLDHPEHLHIHFSFWEKEPKVKNKRATGYLYRKKGKIQMSCIDKMVERLNAYELDDDLKCRRHSATETMQDEATYSKLLHDDILRTRLQRLADELPKGHYGYAYREMKPYREKIDDLAEVLIRRCPKLEAADKSFRNELERKEKELKTIMGNYYKSREQKEISLLENAPCMSDEWELKDVHTIERLKFDYRRRLGNILLRQIQYIQENGYKRNPNRKYGLNNKRLKRKKAISTRVVGKSITDFLSSLETLFQPEIGDCNNRLRQIEKEIKEENEREKEKKQEVRYHYDEGMTR